MKKISVIVPMYNSFSMMKQNLEILSKQTSAKIELIIVDDCSTDDSFAKAKEYARKSALEIIVIQNKCNGGPGVSRNNGMAYATGDYVTFVDSDDYVSDNFTEILAPLMERNFDSIIFDYINVTESGHTLSSGRSIGCSHITPGMIDTKVAFVYTYGSTWGKIYRRELVSLCGAKFGEYFRNEDMLFTKHMLAASKSVYYTSDTLYRYVQQASSLMHQTNLTDEKNGQTSFLLLQERLKEYNLEDELLSIELREVLNNTVLIKIQKKETQKEIIKYIREHYCKQYITNKYFKGMPLYVKVISYCAYYKLIWGLVLILKYKNYKKR